MATELPKEIIEEIEKNKDCPMNDVNFDPETIDGRGEIKKENK